MKTNGLYITSRVIDGVYPDYKQIIPKKRTQYDRSFVLKQDNYKFFESFKIFFLG